VAGDQSCGTLLYRPAGTVYGVAGDTRERILTAVRDLLAHGGPSEVTLEAVASRAGISKGGLLYHFSSKAALYLGLQERVRDTVAAEMADRAARGDAARAYLDYAAPESEDEAEFFTSLIAAVRTGEDADPQALALLADSFRAWEAPMRAAVADPVRAETIRLVGIGLYLGATAGLPQPEPELLAAVFERLLA
jgi:AcrR family transcriptional regulator